MKQSPLRPQNNTIKYNKVYTNPKQLPVFPFAYAVLENFWNNVLTEISAHVLLQVIIIAFLFHHDHGLNVRGIDSP